MIKLSNLSDSRYLLVTYGNHLPGDTFLNYNHIIDEKLSNKIDKIRHQIDGFYFGRYDLRCSRIKDLKMEKNFSILEVNGAGAELAYIYEPDFSFIKAQLILARHFRMLYQAANENNLAGVQYMSYKKFMSIRKLQKVYRLNVSVI